MDDGSQIRESLRDRFPRYLLAFGTGLALAAAVGWVAALLTGAAAAGGVGWGWIVLGVGMLLVGGASGGGLVQPDPGYGVFYGRHHDRGLNDPRGEMARMGDLRRRLRLGLRPRANPAAFWQVVGGFVAAGGGVLLLELAG